MRLSNLTEVTTSPARQRACIQQCTDRLGFTLIAEAADLGVSARKMSPFERPSLSPWLQRPDEYDAIVWSHVDRAVRSVAHLSELVEWGRRHATTLVFVIPEERQPLVVTPQADSDAIRRCMNLAYAAEQEARAPVCAPHQRPRSAARDGPIRRRPCPVRLQEGAAFFRRRLVSRPRPGDRHGCPRDC
ncbi:recombinase family protein [Streptomyces sp. NPDC056468]|uniref:recombinase family protein n=1 Tax=Streptomyces sp. NPDC056468 TaxID=3345830 RepID=UPI0036AAE92D